MTRFLISAAAALFFAIPASPAADADPLRPQVSVEVAYGDLDLSSEAAFEQSDRLKHRRLTRSRRAEQPDDLARPYVEVYTAENVDLDPALLEAASEVDQADDHVTHSAAPAPDRYWPPSLPDTAWRGS